LPRLRRLEIEYQLEMGWLLDRQVGRLGALQDFVNKHGSLTKKLDISRRVGHQPAFLGEPPRHRHRRHSMLHRKLGGALGRQTGLNDQGIGSVQLHPGESGLELLIAANANSIDRSSGGFTAKLYLFKERFGEGIGRIGQSGHSAGGRQHLADQLHTLASQFGGHGSHPGDISTRPRQARDQPSTDRVSCLGHDDRDLMRRLLGRHSGGREPSDDYIDLETDQLIGQFGKPFEVSFRRSKLKSNVLPLDIPEVAQSLAKLPPKLFRIDIADDQCADGRHLRLLRPCRDRPRCRTTERDNEFSPPNLDCHETLP
jgi:hypothetical protein